MEMLNNLNYNFNFLVFFEILNKFRRWTKYLVSRNNFNKTGARPFCFLRTSNSI